MFQYQNQLCFKGLLWNRRIIWEKQLWIWIGTFKEKNVEKPQTGPNQSPTQRKTFVITKNHKPNTKHATKHSIGPFSNFGNVVEHKSRVYFSFAHLPTLKKTNQNSLSVKKVNRSQSEILNNSPTITKNTPTVTDIYFINWWQNFMKSLQNIKKRRCWFENRGKQSNESGILVQQRFVQII